MAGRKASKYYAKTLGTKVPKRISLGEKSACVMLAYSPSRGDEIADPSIGVIFRETKNGTPELMIVNSGLPKDTKLSVVHGRTVTTIANLTNDVLPLMVEGEEYALPDGE